MAKCTCGCGSIGWNLHSDYCDIQNEVAKERHNFRALYNILVPGNSDGPLHVTRPVVDASFDREDMIKRARAVFVYDNQSHHPYIHVAKAPFGEGLCHFDLDWNWVVPLMIDMSVAVSGMQMIFIMEGLP